VAEFNVGDPHGLVEIIMSSDISEKDWKKLRSLKDDALNIACERILCKINTLIEERGADSHKYYLKLWKVIHSEDKEISVMFDDLKRSTAIFKLAMWKNNGLLSADDFKEFTKETQKRIQSICDLHRQPDR
jgi:hypothetical protein